MDRWAQAGRGLDQFQAAFLGAVSQCIGQSVGNQVQPLTRAVLLVQPLTPAADIVRLVPGGSYGVLMLEGPMKAVIPSKLPPVTCPVAVTLNAPEPKFCALIPLVPLGPVSTAAVDIVRLVP